MLLKIFVQHCATLLAQQCCTMLASFEQVLKLFPMVVSFFSESQNVVAIFGTCH